MEISWVSIAWIAVAWVALIMLVIIGAAMRADRIERLAAHSSLSGATEGAYPIIDPDHGD